MDKRELLLASLDKQFLLGKGQKRQVVSALCGLQAQFANNPGHALRFRAEDYRNDDWNQGLVKTWTFRHTLHVILREELPLFLSAQGIPEKWEDGWGLSGRVKQRWAPVILDWIRDGIADREHLKRKCREQGMRPATLAKMFHGWGGLFSEMCHRGIIAHDSGTLKRFVPCDGFEPVDRDRARAELLERYFRHLGPATLRDCAAFTGYRMTTLRNLLEKYPLPLQSVRCAGEDYWYIDGWDVRKDLPACLFLAGFDQLLLAYRDRTRLLDHRHKSDVVTNTGIIHPTILVDGRLVAKWRKVGSTIAVTPFTRLTKACRGLIHDTATTTFGADINTVEFAGDARTTGTKARARRGDERE